MELSARRPLYKYTRIYSNKGYLIPHNTSPSYATFAALPESIQAFSQNVKDSIFPSIQASTAITSVLVSNTYTYTEPSLAVNPVDDHTLMLWVHDDINKPVGQSQEINFSLWNGSAWSVPNGVTDDYYLDGAPQVAWTGSSDGVAVWERLPESLPITATWDITTAKKIEIAASTYNPLANAWSPVSLLTTNTALDMKPQLASNASGQLLAVWRQNEAGLLSGNPANPDHIMTAFYNGSWGIPAAAVDNIPGLLDLAAGYGNNAATIAYSRYLTPTGSLTPTLQLFTSAWNGSSWSVPVQRTDDSLGHRNPRIVYNTANQPLLVWLAGGELRLHNLTSDATATLTLPSAIGSIDQFRIVQDGSGNIAAVFTAQAAQRDLYLAFYDQSHDLWGNPRKLTDDRASESYPAPALDSTGRLLMGYSTTAIHSVVHTIISNGETITFTIPTEGQTDLMTLSHVFDRNLTLSDDGLTISNEYPAPGSSIVISATILNSGDLALDNVAVSFYDGDPLAGGTLIGMSNLPTPLAAGFTATLTTTYLVSSTGGAHVIYAVVDPSNIISELDETDNTASLAAFGPDLEITSAAVDYWGGSEVGLQTWIANIGTSASPTTTLSFYQDTLTGTLLVTDTVHPIAPGGILTLTTPWNFGALSAGSYPLIAIANPGKFTETFTNNNNYLLSLEVLPDLMVSPYYLWSTSLTDTSILITATIYNIGPITATDVVVGFYDRWTLDGEAQVLTRTIPLMPPASAVYITDTLSGPIGCGLYVLADPGMAITETTRSNNLAAIMAEGGRCANFWYQPSAGLPPLTVVFTDTSSGSNTAWHWDFGDNVTSDTQNPTHIYTIPGIYSVTFQVSGADGTDEFTRANAIRVYAPAQAAFSATPMDGLAPLMVSFTDQSSGDIYNWQWDFGDGDASATKDPVHEYTVPGVYTVTLTVSGLGGTDTEVKPGYITVYTPVQAGFTAAPTLGIAPLNVVFANTSSGDYTASLWDFGDGSVSSAQNPSHPYTVPGIFTVTLTASGPGGSDTEVKTSYITVYEPVNADFTAAPTSGIPPFITVFTNTTTGDYATSLWKFGDGITSTLESPTHTYTAPGFYTVTLTASGLGGTDTEMKVSYISAYASVHADFTATPVFGVAPLEVEFINNSVGDYTSCAWNYGDESASSLCTPLPYTYILPGVYTVTLAVSGSGGSDSESKAAYITVLQGTRYVYLPLILRESHGGIAYQPGKPTGELMSQSYTDPPVNLSFVQRVILLLIGEIGMMAWIRVKL